ncbi:MULTISPECIES: PBP1A family penicillin-binding protein [unclassified Paenibacillus]|uniref:transglycosylase domain-containing protein n=1 Tax=unclassified Paenibacillus TaxID=185978 RepID=UPI001AEAB7EC|nr:MULTISPECIES: PBP1A family penicillin-binding protein [unclassified Paenibacillus]MBP1153433.1 1A family penicillin-binding protein [Paenibacillus sp. PvP091]MBP1171184.1 1A family penicillin-binding protein [Paenibacillus sp. PvR098]MBP2442212.1 1A family penicillin-binding protein [Paenibacillus sp. PvP052]
MNEERNNRPAAQDEPLERLMKRMKAWASFSFTCLILGAAGLLVALLFMRSQSLPVSKMAMASEIYDVNGTMIEAHGGSKNRQMISLKEISPKVIEATLAIEDRNFYDHYGFDPKGIARAAWVNLQHMSKVQGAGTITQQLARNLFLTHERTWSRKIKETYYAVQLELQMSKEQILEQYLNQIYYGHSTYGIQAASLLFFGKDASQLTLAESALLAGVPKGPRYYSPYYDLQNSLNRQKTVLQTMVEAGYVTQRQADQAAREKLNILPLEDKKPVTAPYFRDYVRGAATELLGMEEKEFEESGLRIYTSLDLKAQKIAEDVVTEQLKDYPELQTALVAIDPRSGYVKAMVGGRNYGENQYNRVFANTRQPGSSFKPIVYLTALKEKQFSPVTRFLSEPTTFTYDQGRQTYTPSNFGNKYLDWIDLRTAVAKSDNIFAVHTALETGPDRVIEMARRMGITSPMKPVPSLALGTFPVSPFEMASAFGILANQGVRVEPTAILRIEDRRGRLLYEAAPKQEAVIEPAYTYVLTKLMESVFDQGGTGSRVSRVLKRPVAGKTGTTNADAWLVGYTPELSTAVWVGYDKDRNISSVESHLAAPIFAEFTERTLESVPPKLFPIPEGIVNVYIDPATGKLANESCPDSRLEAFVQGTEPKEYCTQQPAQDDRDGGTTPGKGKPNGSWWEDLKHWWNS